MHRAFIYLSIQFHVERREDVLSLHQILRPIVCHGVKNLGVRKWARRAIYAAGIFPVFAESSIATISPETVTEPPFIFPKGDVMISNVVLLSSCGGVPVTVKM